MQERHDGQAVLGASLTAVSWLAWMAASTRFRTIELLGPFLFWAAPVFLACLVWLCFLLAAPRGVPMKRALRGVAIGTAAALLGFPLSVISGVLFAFGAFWPITVFSLVLEMVVLAVGVAAMFALCRVALDSLLGRVEAQ